MSALLPKLQGAQDIARDTSRQLAIRDLQAGMAGYYSLNGKWPVSGDQQNASGSCSDLRDKLINESNLMSSLPQEPNTENTNSFNGLTGNGQYLYFILPPILIELPNIQVMNQNSQLQLKSHIK